MARVLIYLGVFVLLGFTAKLNISDNKSNELEDEHTLRLFESLSADLESAKSYKEHVTSKEKLIQFGRIVNLENKETLICQALLQESNEILVLYDFFIKEVLSEGPCRRSLISNQATYLREFKTQLLDIDLNGNIKINTDSIDEYKKIKTVKSIDNEQNIFYGPEFPKNYLALTFDDGPHHIYTEIVVGILDAYGAEGSFFMVGNRVNKHKEIVQAVAEKGNMVGSHSLDHQHLSKVSTDLAFENIINGHNLIKEILIGTPEFFQNIFRFPYGLTTPELQRKVSDAGFSTFFWNIDSRDWGTSNPREIKDAIIGSIKRKKRGSILLLHDFYVQTVFALPLLLEELIEMEEITLIRLVNGGSDANIVIESV